MPKYPDDDYLSRQEIDDLRSEAKHPAKYMKAFFDFKIEARYSFSVNWSEYIQRNQAFFQKY